jgi:hypothetical protein
VTAAGVTVGQLWRAVFPAARLAGPDAALDRPVAWVRVLKPRTPAFDALDTDDLAIVPVGALVNLGAMGVDADSISEAVTLAKACGVLVVGDADSGAAPAVLNAAARHGLAALHLPDADVNALERSAIGFVVNARAELDARAAELELELEQAAQAGAGLDGLAAIISRFFARPIAIEADDGTILAVHTGAESKEGAPQVSGYLRQRRGAAMRVALPAPGTLVLLGSQPVSDLERVASSRLAPFRGLALVAPAGRAGARGGERLPADGPPWVALVARQYDADDQPGLPEREKARSALKHLEPARRLVLRGDATSLELRIIYAPTPADPLGADLAGRLSRRIGRPVAVSESFATAGERAAREATARATLEAFEALPAVEQRQLATAAGGTVVHANLLPALRLMGGLTAMPDASRHARTMLQPLLSGRRARDAHTLATLRAVLDHAGMAEAAAALGIHRNTLAYRLAVIERRTGWRMSDPLVRFGLALAVRFVQSDQDSAG